MLKEFHPKITIKRAMKLKLIKLNYLILGAVFVFFTGCSQNKLLIESTDLPIERLRKEIGQIANNPAFSNAFWGIAIQSTQTGEFIYQHNENKGFLPASNMKLFTTAAALVKLGPDFSYETDIFLNGKMTTSGKFQGDLIIRGSGDPSIGSRYLQLPNGVQKLREFRSWARSLKNEGISIIEGNIIGDDNYLSDQPLGFGWSWDDEAEWYAAQISALTLHDNCVDILFAPGDSLNDLAGYQIFPKTRYAIIHNYVKTVPANEAEGIHFSRKRGTNELSFYGTIPGNGQPLRKRFTIENPTSFFVAVFKDILANEGIHVQGNALDIDELTDYCYDADDSSRMIQHLSPPLKDILQTVNKKSQNLWTELLLRTLGAEFGENGSSRQGIQAVKSFLKRTGIDPNTISIADGSGLSRHNLVSPLQIITLLRYIRRHQFGEAFYNSLPVAGLDGTLKRRMLGTNAQEKVRAKTGTLNHVKALSGYIQSKDNEEFVFSIIANNYTVPTAMAVNLQDLICERLANFQRK